MRQPEKVGVRQVLRGAITLFVLAGVACENATEPPVVTTLEAVDLETQSGVAGAAVAIEPAVRVLDQRGQPMPGVRVTFTVILGDGRVELPEPVSDARGIASAGEWTLGTQAGPQIVTASVGSISSTFEATALPGEPASVEVVEGDGQAATVGTAVGVAPAVRVRDSWGNPVPGVDMQFEVLPGSGEVDAAQSSGPAAEVETDSTGIARLVRWVLGTQAGPNSLKATANGHSVILLATAEAGVPIAIRTVEGDLQSAPVNEPLPLAPVVRVIDEFQNPVPDVPVRFTVSSGGGSLDLTEVATDTSGLASPGTWRMGPAGGTNAMTASIGGVAAGVTFTATATTSSGGGAGSMNSTYDLELVLGGSISATQAQAFYMAADRWARVIASDLPDVDVSIPANSCGITHPAINRVVDDLIILVEVVPIDGPGNILGAAGPCYLRSAGGLPVVGAMQLDEADVAYLESNGKLEDVVAHEIGHIMGVGTRWGSLLIGAGTGDPYFAGPDAVADFRGSGGTAYPGSPVPVENTGGPGTRDGHWRESIFQNELMTGWLDMGPNPLSSITVSSLADIGYAVNMAGADAFSLPISAAATSQDATTRPAGIRIEDRPLPIVPIAVDARGRPAPLTGIRR